MKKFLIIQIILLSFVYAEKTAVIEIDGMTCPLCTVAVKKSLKKTEGVIKAKVKLSTQKATVKFKDDLNSSKLLEAIERAGYKGKILSVTENNKSR